MSSYMEMNMLQLGTLLRPIARGLRLKNRCSGRESSLIVMKICKTACGAVAGLAMAASSICTAQPAQTTTNLLAITTFDSERPQAWGYGYFYGPAGSYQQPNRMYYDPEDLEMSNPMVLYSFDLTGLDGSTGYGTGFGGPLFRPDTDPSLFVSTNRVDYVFSWDARVDGLAPGVQSANLEMQVQLFSSEFTPDKVLQVNLGFQARTNWTHYVRTLEDGGLGDNTSERIFAEAYRSISDVRYNVNVHEPHQYFGFDGDNWIENNLNNSIMLDNLKLEVIVRPVDTTPPLPTFTEVIADWNLDDKPLDYSYGGYTWSQINDVQPVFTYDSAAAGEGVDGSNAWALYMDNSAFAWTAPQWAGGGTGGSGPKDLSHFTTGDLSQYKITFQAKARGMVSETATGVLQVFLDSPDNTLQPPDANDGNDLLVRLDFQVAGLTSEYQTYSMTLNRGTAGSGSKDNFTAHFSDVIDVRTQWQIENAASQATWGFDDDNAFIIDNILIERIYTGLPAVRITADGGVVSINWGGASNLKLQTATSVAGPWSDLTAPANPYTVTPAQGEVRFFRTVAAP
jgi:hypothetical protein